MSTLKILTMSFTGALALVSYFSVTGQAKTSTYREFPVHHSLFASKEGDALRAKIVAIGQQSSCAGVVFKCDSFAAFVKTEMVK